ncbi:hypothetical protein CFH99_14680 [Nocardioides aromaticivorans]|uniref:Uncharacterized protein n=1 Tax=Nocardioides aromaticivorans TaxID=200618 RepID=A0ABX7PMI3_9ACTN|nr:hypothetical protein [Nocardioides aromaticivorans]QSR26873.1 hypothetical protein CFH99_14680 [Nocardioides aromaticivorans]
MSLLMFLHEDDGATIVTDTLATDLAGKPLNFVDKAIPLPSMNLVVATTGYQQLMLRWIDRLRENVRARDITMLDLHTPESLREIWAELQREHGVTEGTATIYHFGIDEHTGVCRRFAYRSADNFVSEEGSTPAFGVKPEPGGGTQPDDLNDPGLIDFARRIREEQDAKAADRIYVGGDLVVTEVRKNSISQHRIYRWEDQWDQWQAICGAPPLGLKAHLP